MMMIEKIFRELHWKGIKMIFPYYWNGELRCARIMAHKLLKSIEWDVKKP